jgi:hypothetical protein
MSNMALRSVYALTVLRLVNGVVDPSQKGRWVCAPPPCPPKRRSQERDDRCTETAAACERGPTS